MILTILVGFTDSGTKLVTASLLKQYVKSRCKKIDSEQTQKLCGVIIRLICSSRSTLDTKEVLASSLKVMINKAHSRLSFIKPRY